MTTTELLAVFRQEVFDLQTPYLWADSLIYTYIDDAQKQFCRWTYGIEDARNFKLTIKTDGTEWYALDPMILKLRDAIDPATGDSITLVAAEKMREKGMKFDGKQGPLRALVTGLEKGYVRTHPVPNVASVVELHTFRLSNDVGANDEFEIDAQHILPLLYWVKSKAYGVQDTETYNPKLSAEFEQKFRDYCAQAKVEQSRARRPVSTVSYGGL